MIEILSAGNGLSARQRWGHNFVILFAVAALFIGINLRDSTLTATSFYINTEAGIRSEYPQNWLIDSEGDYVFRVRNVSQIGFPTTIQVSVRPVGGETPSRYILDSLTLNRSQTLSSYNVLSSGVPYTLPDESAATLMNYTFAATENNPFLESIPIVVRGQDILTVQRGQAIIITFLDDATTYEQNYPIFERFVNSLEF